MHCNICESRHGSKAWLIPSYQIVPRHQPFSLPDALTAVIYRTMGAGPLLVECAARTHDMHSMEGISSSNKAGCNGTGTPANPSSSRQARGFYHTRICYLPTSSSFSRCDSSGLVQHGNPRTNLHSSYTDSARRENALRSNLALARAVAYFPAAAARCSMAAKASLAPAPSLASVADVQQASLLQVSVFRSISRKLLPDLFSRSRPTSNAWNWADTVSAALKRVGIVS